MPERVNICCSHVACQQVIRDRVTAATDYAILEGYELGRREGAEAALSALESLADEIEDHVIRPECSNDSCRECITALAIRVSIAEGLERATHVPPTPATPSETSEPAALGYCAACEHPVGYHTHDRGCTMPVDAEGFPIMRTQDQVRVCGCSA